MSSVACLPPGLELTQNGLSWDYLPEHLLSALHVAWAPHDKVAGFREEVSRRVRVRERSKRTRGCCGASSPHLGGQEASLVPYLVGYKGAARPARFKRRGSRSSS